MPGEWGQQHRRLRTKGGSSTQEVPHVPHRVSVVITRTLFPLLYSDGRTPTFGWLKRPPLKLGKLPGNLQAASLAAQPRLLMSLPDSVLRDSLCSGDSVTEHRGQSGTVPGLGLWNPRFWNGPGTVGPFASPQGRSHRERSDLLGGRSGDERGGQGAWPGCLAVAAGTHIGRPRAGGMSGGLPTSPPFRP